MVARRFALLIIVALTTTLLVASSADAKSSTKVIVSFKLPAFHGSVKSSKGACAANRTVELFRKKPGPDKLLGTDKSNAKAEWAILIGKRPAAGSYYAKAPATAHCGAAKSNVVPVG